MAGDETKDVAFFNAQDGVKGRDGGPYLDYEERYKAEVRRAVLEDREPAEYGENVPATVGTQLRVGALVEDNSYYSNPSMKDAPGLEAALLKDGDNDHLADPVSVLPVSVGTTPPDDADNATTTGAPSGGTDLSSSAQGHGNDDDEDEPVKATPTKATPQKKVTN
jgi:hypothetical protein